MFGKSTELAFSEYEQRKANVLRNHPNFKISEIWHCEWEKQKKEDPELKHFLTKIYRYPPLQRLDPRAAGIALSSTICTILTHCFLVRGGINEVFRGFWDFHLAKPGEKLNYLDLISSYPFAAMGLLPTGKYQVNI